MIDIKSLRIGNHLQRLDGSVFSVTIDDLVDIHNWSANERLLPSGIPLDEGWLRRLGYSKYPNENTWKHPCGVWIGDFAGNYQSHGMRAGTWLTTVNQLQNFVFACCGEELKVADV